MTSQITAGMPILCADGVPYGTVEAIEREYLRTMPTPDGRKHFIPLDQVARVDQAVHLHVTYDALLALL